MEERHRRIVCVLYGIVKASLYFVEEKDRTVWSEKRERWWMGRKKQRPVNEMVDRERDGCNLSSFTTREKLPSDCKRLAGSRLPSIQHLDFRSVFSVRFWIHPLSPSSQTFLFQ